MTRSQNRRFRSAPALVLATAVPLLQGLVAANVALAGTNQVALRVLVVSTGTPSQDVGLDLLDDVLGNAGIPYDVLNARTTELTAAQLENADYGHYNGVILTDSQVSYYADGQTQLLLSATEWATLRSYETRYGVRESVLSGWPAVDPAAGLDYGLEFTGEVVSSAAPANTTWRSPAGGNEYFEYVKPSVALVVDDFAYLTKPSSNPSSTTPTVTPLLVANNDSNKIMIAALRYPDGREVLYSTIAQAPYLAHSKILAYEFVNFATKGVFLGARQTFLSTHVDDLFLESAIWNAELNTTPEQDTDPGYRTYRMTSGDVTNAISAQSALRNAHPMATSYVIDFAFNGWGAINGDPLTSSIVNNKSRFRFLNHTYEHADMNLVTYDEAYYQIQQNLTVWNQLGLPDLSNNRPVLVTGKHSGLHTETAPFPEGMDPDFFAAARDAGIRLLASDSSQPGEDVERYAPGYPIVMLPRRPSAVFYNVTTPAELVDEYNFIFYERYFLPPYSLDAGTPPCSVYPGAICAPRNYDQILAAEAEMALRQLLEFRMWPYFMHQANLRKYGSSNRTLLLDWVNAVASRYERNLQKIPLKSLPYYQIGNYTRDRLATAGATITAIWDRSTNNVTVKSNKAVKLWATGLSGGSLYGGQRQRYLSLSRDAQTSITVDRALTQ